MSSFFNELKRRNVVRLAIGLVLIALAFPVYGGTDPEPPAPEVSPSRVSLAVLPFVNMSSDPEGGCFADVFTTGLLNLLAREPGLMVADRASVFSYKGQNKYVLEIGRELGVTMLVEGSIRKAGNRVRITVQLINTEDGFHIWSETFDRRIEDLSAILEEIAELVAEAVKTSQ